MARILRGDIRWANLNPAQGREQAGQRPVLILSHDVFNERSNTVIAVALTSQPQIKTFGDLISNECLMKTAEIST